MGALHANPTSRKARVCAVSYLNTLPLVWGMLHGDQKDQFDLTFGLPAECADRLAAGTADIGIVPSAELPRLGLEIIRGTGIACRGPVRSILLISKVPPAEIKTIAMDSSSRTSVVLARIILAQRYSVEPRRVSMAPDLPRMLERADAALIIGDPALLLDPATLPFHVLDLGEEWTKLTGLPMVFAVWAGKPEVVNSRIEQAFLESCRFGMRNLSEIVLLESAPRGIPKGLATKYLEENVVLELTETEYRGLEQFLLYAAELSMEEPMLSGRQ